MGRDSRRVLTSPGYVTAPERRIRLVYQQTRTERAAFLISMNEACYLYQLVTSGVFQYTRISHTVMMLFLRNYP